MFVVNEYENIKWVQSIRLKMQPAKLVCLDAFLWQSFDTDSIILRKITWPNSYIFFIICSKLFLGGFFWSFVEGVAALCFDLVWAHATFFRLSFAQKRFADSVFSFNSFSHSYHAFFSLLLFNSFSSFFWSQTLQFYRFLLYKNIMLLYCILLKGIRWTITVVIFK